MGTKMQAAVEQYIDRRRARPKPGAIESIASVLRRLAQDWDETNRSPRSIDSVWLEDWILDRKVKSNTLGVYESYVVQFMEWCEARDIVRPGWRWTRMGNSSTHREKPFLWLSPQFFTELIAAQENWYWRGLLAITTYTLGRGQEIRDRRLMDVRLSEGSIFWTRTKVGDYNDFVPICTELHEELERYLAAYRQHVGELKDSYYLLPAYRNYFGKKDEVMPDQKRYGLFVPVKRLIEPHLDPELLAQDPDLLKGEGGHTIRRSQARNLYESLKLQGINDPLQIVQAMLGHKNRSMTEHYIGLDSGRQARNEALRGRSFFAPTAATPAATVVELHRSNEGATG